MHTLYTYTMYVHGILWCHFIGTAQTLKMTDDLRQSHKDMFLNLEVGYEMGLKPVQTSINHEYHQLRKHSDSYSMIGLEKSSSYKNEWNIKENHG